MVRNNKMPDKNIAIIGSGYVGLVVGACFAELGNKVICVDSDKEKISKLNQGIVPIYELGLESLIKRNKEEARLFFTTEIREAVKLSEIIFLCIGTPPKSDGEPDLNAIEKVIKEIGEAADCYKLIVEKSTVPVQTASWLKKITGRYLKEDFDIAVNPEFLSEGSAVHDFMNPGRIIIGTESNRALDLLAELYKPLNSPVMPTDINSAEIIKHLSNAMLAQRISTINLIAELCEATNTDIEIVAKGVGMDKRIGKDFLRAGIGYGGFCFPKDVDSLISILKKLGIDPSIFESVQRVNIKAKQNFVVKIEKVLGSLKEKRIAVFGLAFKPDTDDIRMAPSVDIVGRLKEKGAKITAYDPKAMENAKGMLKGIEYGKNLYDAAAGADALLILTEWQEFRDMDLSKLKKAMKNPVIIDGRNLFNKERMKGLGFNYFSVGR